MRAHISRKGILFSDLNMVHEMPLRQKENYAPPQGKHMG
jgi:hypothetical protein